jgi:hypothetical protein
LIPQVALYGVSEPWADTTQFVQEKVCPNVRKFAAQVIVVGMAEETTAVVFAWLNAGTE